jgi:hypothetical protein
MPLLRPDQVEQARNAQLKIAFDKLKRGVGITAREQKLIDQAAIDDGIATHVQTWEQLADALGMARRHLQRWRADDPDGIPEVTAQGHDVQAWKDYAARTGKRVAERASLEELKSDLLAEQIRKLTLANDAAEKKFVALDEVLGAIRPTLGAFRQALDSLPHRAALKLDGDYHETVEVIQSEVEIVFRIFSGAAWFDESAEVDVSEVSIDTSDIPSIEDAGKVRVVKKKPGRKKRL